MPLTAGSRLGGYEILAPLGTGGMGEVYRAFDVRLEREVALKVLSGDVASNADRLMRFEREARTVAGLNHPNIVTLYSVEDADDVRFLTMELVDGHSLDVALPPEGLPIAQVLRIGVAMADALAAAHEKGIIHRDIKPANVMMTSDGRVKVLDFGLAKPTGSASDGASTSDSSAPTMAAPIDDMLTRVGAVLGTAPYMSPEQTGGETLDARSDIFSMGVVLYELATGQRPFQGKNRAEITSSILRDTPVLVTQIRKDAPSRLARIIERCLQKEPAARFQSAKDVRDEIHALQAGTSGAARKPRVAWSLAIAGVAVAVAMGWILFRARGNPGGPSATGSDSHSIAVLPFVNMSSDPEQAYFSDGISEQLINLLARVPELRVIARASSFSFRKKNIEVPEIARRLHVANVLEGSVQRAGNRVRITAQLVAASTETQIWSQSYDRTLDDVFTIQDEIAADVVRHLQIRLLGAAPKSRPTDPEAYTYYLQALQLARLNTAEACARADSLHRRVLEIDPRFAPAWTALASDYIIEQSLGALPVKESLERARAAATRALAIDPEFAVGHSMLGNVALYEGDPAGAATHYQHAIAIEPMNMNVLANAGALLQSLGRFGESEAIDSAIAHRDPVNPRVLHNLANDLIQVRRYDESIAVFRTLLGLAPERGKVRADLARALVLDGQAAAALTELEQEKVEVWRMIVLPVVYHALGRKEDSDAALAALTKKYERDAPFNIAFVHAYRGEADRAFEWLNRAVEYQDAGLSEILGQPFFDPIRTDPRWLPFLRRVGRAPEQLEKIQFKLTLPAATDPSQGAST